MGVYPCPPGVEEKIDDWQFIVKCPACGTDLTFRGREAIERYHRTREQEKEKDGWLQ